MGGIVGIDPGPLSLRELFVMVQARQKEEWNRTAAIMSLVANVNRDPKKSRAFDIKDFHPMLQKNKKIWIGDPSKLKDYFNNGEFSKCLAET